MDAPWNEASTVASFLSRKARAGLTNSLQPGVFET
jgi:hypothetical protein